MPRRGENIRKRKDGRWEGRYPVTCKDTGRRTVHSVYGKSYAQTREKLLQARVQEEEAQKEGAAGTEIKGHIKVSFGIAAEEWLEDVRRTKKYSTYWKYRTVYEKHLAGKTSGLVLSELNEENIAKALEETWQQDKISDSLKKSIVCVLNQILAYAASHYRTGLAKYPYQKSGRMRRSVQVLSREEQARLLRCLYKETDSYKLGILISLFTGLRLGEVCALKWSDIDLKGRTLRVNRTVQRLAVEGQAVKTALIEGEPKSPCSKREIPLSEETARVLGLFGKKEGYVSGSRKAADPRTYQNRFQKCLTEAGIGKRNFHILRHTFATNWIAGGADPKSLSEILGHSDVKVTLNRYVHPGMETKRMHMNTISSIYGQYMGQKTDEPLILSD